MENKVEFLTFKKVGMEEVPAWQTTYGIDDNDEVYLPAGMLDTEEGAFFRASFDDVGLVMYKNHLYAPSDWLMSEYPFAAAAIEMGKRHALDLREKSKVAA